MRCSLSCMCVHDPTKLMLPGLRNQISRFLQTIPGKRIPGGQIVPGNRVEDEGLTTQLSKTVLRQSTSHSRCLLFQLHIGSVLVFPASRAENLKLDGTGRCFCLWRDVERMSDLSISGGGLIQPFLAAAPPVLENFL